MTYVSIKDKGGRFYWVVGTFWLTMIALAIVSVFFKSFEILLNVILAIFGVVAGYYISHYFAKRSEAQSLGQYATAGYRSSVDIYNSLSESLRHIESLKKSLSNKDHPTKQETILMFDTISGRLKVLQRSALSVNHHWIEALPDKERQELDAEEHTFDLSDEKEVKITEKTHVISPGRKHSLNS